MSKGRMLAPGLCLTMLWAVVPHARAADEPPVTLRWRFQTGDTLRYELRQKNEIKVNANAQENSTSSELTLDLTWKVKGVADNGTADIAQVMQRARTRINAGTQTITYDSQDPKASDNPAARSLAAVYGAAVGKDYHLKVDARGQIIEAKVPEEVVEAVRGSPFQAMADSGGVLSELGVKNMLAQVFPAFPEKAVARGSSWESTLDLPSSPVRLTLKNVYTPAALDPSSVKLGATINAAIKTDPDSAFTVDVKKESGTGTFAVDTKAGRVVDSAIKQALELTLNVMNRELQQVIAIELQMKLQP